MVTIKTRAQRDALVKLLPELRWPVEISTQSLATGTLTVFSGVDTAEEAAHRIDTDGKVKDR